MAGKTALFSLLLKDFVFKNIHSVPRKVGENLLASIFALRITWGVLLPLVGFINHTLVGVLLSSQFNSSISNITLMFALFTENITNVMKQRLINLLYVFLVLLSTNIYYLHLSVSYIPTLCIVGLYFSVNLTFCPLFPCVCFYHWLGAIGVLSMHTKPVIENVLGSQILYSAFSLQFESAVLSFLPPRITIFFSSTFTRQIICNSVGVFLCFC